MADHSTIEWTQATWNPVTGCDKVSPGCAHCYAETFAERWRGIPGHPYEQGFDLRLWPDRLDLPLRWSRPRLVFVNSMSDIFHERIPFEFVQKIFDVMKRADWHVFQLLTKRHERMAELAQQLEWPSNVWMGVSIENERFATRADALRRVPAAVRFISAEPLLGPLRDLDLAGIHWVIAGGESGPGHRSVDIEWLRDIRDRCEVANIAFFFKQWGGRTSKAGGRVLDGQYWSDMPASVSRQSDLGTLAQTAVQIRNEAVPVTEGRHRTVPQIDSQFDSQSPRTLADKDGRRRTNGGRVQLRGRRGRTVADGSSTR